MTSWLDAAVSPPLWDRPKPALKAAVIVLTEAFTASDGSRWADVSTKLPPRNRPDRFVVVSRRGGGQVDQTTDNARILVECYARTTGEAEEMTGSCRAALRNSGGTWVYPDDSDPIFIRRYGGETGLTDLPNPEVLEYERWQFLGELFIAVNR